jgi:hypothetical protein
MTRQGTAVQHKDVGPLDRNFEKLVNETLELWHVPGVSVAVIDGENTWTKVSPFFELFPIILTTFVGLWHRLLPFHTRDFVNTFLRRQHNKSIYSSHYVIPSRRQ